MYRHSASILALLYSFSFPHLGLSQTSDNLMIFNQGAHISVVGSGGKLYWIDLEKGETTLLGPYPSDSLFEYNTYPNQKSGAIGDGEFFLWDSSIGSVVRYGKDGTGTVYQSRATMSFFNHASAYNGAINAPVVFGGYGFWRASDFFLYFDTSQSSWQEMTQTDAPDRPRSRQNARLLYSSPDSVIYIIGGDTSDKYYNYSINTAIDDDAWAFHTPTGEYEPIFFPPELKRAFSGPAVIEWFSPKTNEQHFVSMSSKDQGSTGGDQVINFWKPKSDEYATIETQFKPLPNHRIAAISISGDSMHILQVPRFTGMNQPPAINQVAIKIPYPVSFSSRNNSLGNTLLFIVLAILVIPSIYSLTKRKLNPIKSPFVRFQQGDFYITIYSDDTALKRVLSSNSLLLIGLLKDLEHGVQIPLKRLLERYQELSQLDDSSSRTVLYRSIAEINDVFVATCSEVLIQKTKDSKDRRSILLSLNFPIKGY